MKSQKVRDSLERIRAEAVRKVKTKDRPKVEKVVTETNEVLKVVRSKLTNQLVNKIAIESANSVLQKFTNILEKKIQLLKDEVSDKLSINLNHCTVSDKNGIAMHPEGCRFLHVNSWNDQPQRHGTMVIEQPPAFRNIFAGTRHYIPMPYVIFNIGFVQVKDTKQYHYSALNVGFNKQPLNSLADKMYHATLPNIGGHSVCMGDYQPGYKKSLPQVADHLIGAFWQSRFNGGFRRFTVKGQSITNYRDWATLDLLQILDANFALGSSLEDLLGAYSVDNNSLNRKMANIAMEAWRDIMKEISAHPVAGVEWAGPNSAASLIKNCALKILDSVLTLQPEKTVVQ